VKDPGVGIPPGEQQRIFEPFVRGEIARNRQIRGTGVGLALSRSIVRAHGGDITVESEPNAGSTFTISLPAAARGQD
jgi:signal transduction histidine kinase